jgi:hypothetical protein
MKPVLHSPTSTFCSLFSLNINTPSHPAWKYIKAPEQYNTKVLMRLIPLYAIALLIFTGHVMAEEQTTVNNNVNKLAMIQPKSPLS